MSAILSISKLLDCTSASASIGNSSISMFPSSYLFLFSPTICLLLVGSVSSPSPTPPHCFLAKYSAVASAFSVIAIGLPSASFFSYTFGLYHDYNCFICAHLDLSSAPSSLSLICAILSFFAAFLISFVNSSAFCQSLSSLAFPLSSSFCHVPSVM